VLVCHAAMVESTKCAGALARFHVRRDKPAIGAGGQSVRRESPRRRSENHVRSTPKIRAMYSKPAVDKVGLLEMNRLY